MHSRASGVLIVGGPTCSGKTGLALELAERFDAEIIGADSRQIYRGMPIGTAAPTAVQRSRVAHHLVEFLDPYERYSAARFTHDALAALADIHARGKRAIVTGGTGFYIRALCGDVALSPAFDAPLRARLAREAKLHPPEVLHAWLSVRAPLRAASLAPTDGYRIVRALEIALSESADDDARWNRQESAQQNSEQQGPIQQSAVQQGAAEPNHARQGHVQQSHVQQSNLKYNSDAQPSLRSVGLAFLKIVLTVRDDELSSRIEDRVDAMLAAGLLAEAEAIGPDAVAADAVGYPQALAYLAGAATFGELRASLVRATRRYAKRQRTWFRSEPHTHWLPATDVVNAAREVFAW